MLVLFQFKAGKLHLNGTKMSADTRKGLVFVEIGDDDLIHFKWKDRTKGNLILLIRKEECTNFRAEFF